MEQLIKHEIFIYLLLAYLLSHIPIIGRYVSMINTLVHENGHALVALLLNGRVYSIKLYHNTAGEAITGHSGWFSSVAISYAGYTFSSVVAYGCFMLLSKGYIKAILYLLVVIALISLVLWIRNLYGGLWLVSFIILCGWLIHNGSILWQTVLAYLFSSVLLTQSVSSALEIFILSIIQRKSAGDASNLASYTKIPAVFWGFLFFTQALYIAFLAIRDHIT